MYNLSEGATGGNFCNCFGNILLAASGNVFVAVSQSALSVAYPYSSSLFRRVTVESEISAVGIPGGRGNRWRRSPDCHCAELWRYRPCLCQISRARFSPARANGQRQRGAASRNENPCRFVRPSFARAHCITAVRSRSPGVLGEPPGR